MLAVWIEIPARDVERALKFYQEVFNFPAVEISDDGTRRTATLFGGDTQGKSGISLNQTANFEPSDKGVYVYLDAGEDLTPALDKVAPAGGKILAGKTSMGDAGFYATVLDSEGNQIGLYSPK